MNYISTLFKRPDGFRDFGAGYNPSWANSLYLNIQKWSPGSTLNIITDFTDGFLPEITTHSFIYPERNWSSIMELYRPDIVGERSILIGLDNLFVGPASGIESYTSLPYITARDPFNPRPSNALVSLNQESATALWEKWTLHRTSYLNDPKYFINGQFSEMLWLNVHVKPDAFWDDLLPGQLVSYKAHCNKGIPPDARFVYFHGRPKQPELKNMEFVNKNWNFNH